MRVECLLRTLRSVAEALLQQGPWEARIGEVLGHLGQATGADHVHLWRRDAEEPRTEAVWTLRREWAAEGHRRTHRAESPAIAVPGTVLGEHAEALCSGRCVFGRARDLPACREFLEAAGMTDADWLAFLPILADGGCWGLLGLHSRRAGTGGGVPARREWTPATLEALQTAALILGSRRAGIARAHPHAAQEEALRRSEELHRAVVEDQTDLICRFLPDSTLIFVNEAYCRYFGMSRETLLGAKFLSLIPPEDRDLVLGRILALTPDDPIRTHEHRVLRPDGGVGWQQWTNRAILDHDGRIVQFQAVGRDITERKKAEEELLRHRRHLEELVQDRTRDLVAANRRLQREIAERRQTEAALRRSEALYHTTIDALADPIHVVDRDLRITLFNETFTRWCRKLGLKTRALGREVFEAFPFLTDNVRREYAHVFETGEPLMTEDVNRVGGNEVTTETVKIPVMQDGRAVRVITVIRDITERRRAEESLRQSEARYRALVEQIPAITYATGVGREGKTLYVSPQSESFLGLRLQRPDQAHEVWANAIHPDDRARVIEEFDRAKAAAEPFASEYRMVAADGRMVWCRDEAVVVRDQEGRPLFLQGVIFDITDRKHAEEELRRSQRFIQRIADALPEILYVYDHAHGRILFANRQVERTMGYTPDELPAMEPQDVDELVHPEDQALARRHVEALAKAKGEEVCESEFRVRRADGQWRWLRWRGIVFARDAQGAPTQHLGTAHDVTAQKLSDEALRLARRKLIGAREEERSRLARELHDSAIQQIIAMHLRLQQARKELGAQADASVARALDEVAQQSLNLIREVRQVSHGLYPPTLQQFGLHLAMEQLAASCRPAPMSGGAQVETRCAGPITGVRFPAEVEFAVFRIAQEALGNVLRHARATRVQIILSYEDGHVVLEVVDDGVGFDPQASHGGLGLSSMRDRAQALDGELQIASLPGRTEVKVRIPAEPLPPARGDSHASGG